MRRFGAERNTVAMDDIIEATAGYERWLAGQCAVVRPDLRHKHEEMARDPFRFFRATYYRWCQHWDLASDVWRGATSVLAVGDLHLENFGTWRDADGRLVWGVNDFDEATPLPWVSDLVRLAASVLLAIELDRLGLDEREACEVLVDGYANGLARGGEPFVLEEGHASLRKAATGGLRDPQAFWKAMTSLPVTSSPDRTAAARIVDALPEKGLDVRFHRRTSGLGSLGRARFVGVANWRGGLIAREAKALAPSAAAWARSRKMRLLHCARLLRLAVRVPDPTVTADDRWVVRRLAPHCTRVELRDLPQERDELRLIGAMGFETANVHLGTRSARSALRSELRAWSPRRLRKVAAEMVGRLEDDWRLFRRKR